MARQRISIEGVTAAALSLVDARGFDALSLSAVASGLGVGPSALYTHVDGLGGLRYLVAVEATNNLTEAVRTAAIGVSGPSALQAMGGAYRGFALRHPGQYASTLLAAPSDDDELAVATAALVDVFSLVYRAFGLSASSAELAASSTRSALHGFLALEMTGGTTPDHDDRYQHLLDTLARGVEPVR